MRRWRGQSVPAHSLVTHPRARTQGLALGLNPLVRRHVLVDIGGIDRFMLPGKGMLAGATSSDQVTPIIVILVRIFVVLVGVVALLAALRALAAITRYRADVRDVAIDDGGLGLPDEEGKESDEEADDEEVDESHDREAPEPQVPVAASTRLGASFIVQEMPQPGQLPTWWDPVHLVSTAPEAASPSAANTDPAGLRTPSEPAEPLQPARTSAEGLACEEQNDAVTWPDVVNVLAAIGRFFIRFFSGG